MSHRHARVSATEVLVRQPQESHPLVMNCARLLDGIAIAEVTAVRKWIGTYPTIPQLSADPAALVLDDATFAGEFVSIPCTGGVHGTYYYVEVDLLLANGDTRCGDGWLLVKDHDA